MHRIEVAKSEILDIRMPLNQLRRFNILMVVVVLPMELKQLYLYGVDCGKPFLNIRIYYLFGDLDFVKHAPFGGTVDAR
jgi:hypothetical protein